MATRRVPPQAEETGDDATTDNWGVQVPQPSADEIAEESAGDQLRAVFAAAPGENMRVSLYRRDPKSRALQWCEDYTPEQAETGAHELIRESWGAGMYELRAIGKTGIKARVQIEIAQRLQPAAAPAAPQNDQLAQVLAMLAQGQQRIMEALTQRPEPVAPPTMKDLLEQMALMKSVFAAPAPPAPVSGQSQSEMLRDMVQTIKTLREVSEDVAPQKEGDPDNPMSMLPSLIELVKTGMQSRGGNAAHQDTPQQIRLPASLGQSEQPQTQESDPMIQLVLKGAAGELLRLAQSNAPAEQGGEFIHRALPDEFVPMLALPNWFDIVSNYTPELIPHRAWVEQAKAHADVLFSGEPDKVG